MKERMPKFGERRNVWYINSMNEIDSLKFHSSLNKVCDSASAVADCCCKEVFCVGGRRRRVEKEEWKRILFPFSFIDVLCHCLNLYHSHYILILLWIGKQELFVPVALLWNSSESSWLELGVGWCDRKSICFFIYRTNCNITLVYTDVLCPTSIFNLILFKLQLN